MNSCLMNLPRFQLDVNQSTGGLDGHHGLEIFITRRGSDSDQINKSKKSDRPLSFFSKAKATFYRVFASDNNLQIKSRCDNFTTLLFLHILTDQ